MTRWPVDPLTFSKKNPSRANGRSTYTHPPSLAKIRQRTSEEIGNTQTNAARIIVWLGNLPVERAKDAVCFLQWGGVSLASSAIIYNIVKVKVTRRPVDLLEKEPLNSNCQVHLHTSLTCSTAKGAELDSAACQAKGAVAACGVRLAHI